MGCLRSDRVRMRCNLQAGPSESRETTIAPGRRVNNRLPALLFLTIFP